MTTISHDPPARPSQPRPGVPRYFHLLWDEDIERLQPILHVLARRHDEVMGLWRERYAVHFGETRTLGNIEFDDLYGRDLRQTVANLLQGNMETFVADLRAGGERMADRGVPFAEVIAALHLFEESCSDLLDAEEEVGRTQPHDKLALLRVLDKLSHCRVIVIADTYFEATRARATARVRGLEQEVARLSPQVQGRRHFHGIVGQSAPMREVFQRVEAAAASRGTVFLVGESGTGKELVARAIHELGSPPGAPFVPLNCSALPRELIESELFGYKRGAFSGAVSEYLGLFRAAEGGTLFLDEVTEMAADTQAKLLRALQERTIRPVGSVREVAVNVRIIASTNSDPQEAIGRGMLRRDLYYRLNVNAVRLPPLRERLDDLPLLVDYFLDELSHRLRCPRRSMTPEVLTALRRYTWPGNVRELMNVLESVHTFGVLDTIKLADLPAAITRATSSAAARHGSGGIATYAEMERTLIARALEATGGNKVRAAQCLGVSRKKLYAKLAKYGLGDVEPD